MPRVRPMRSLGAASLGVLPGLLVGIAVMIGLGAPRTMPVMNAVALVVGMVILWLAGSGLGREIRAHGGRVGAVVVLVMALPFAFESLEGVHRWIVAGPVRLQPSALLGPVALLSLVALLGDRCVVAAVLLIASIGLVHIAQPDAGQGTALAAGAVVAMLTAPISPRRRLLGVTAAVVGAIVVWLRPDPLQPVAFVEDMPARAFELSPAVGVIAIVALVAVPAAALLPLRTRSAPHGSAAVVLSVYFAATVLVTFIGHFPVPVLGHGASPILGAIVGLGLLGPAAAGRAVARTPTRP